MLVIMSVAIGNVILYIKKQICEDTTTNVDNDSHYPY